jgi:argininosuccinate synthase
MLLTGLPKEDFEAAKEKALKIGASRCYVEERRKEFITELIYHSIQCNSIYENVLSSWYSKLPFLVYSR